MVSFNKNLANVDQVITDGMMVHTFLKGLGC